MSIDAAMFDSRATSRAVVVRRPRSGDGVGSALRDAFGPKPGAMPLEWATLIGRIDRRQ